MADVSHEPKAAEGERTKAQSFDQYTRWLCKHCGKDGIDSWNKGIYDGIDWDDDDNPDNPFVYGGDCMRCEATMVVALYGPDEVPHTIYGPVSVKTGNSVYAYEAEAMAAFENDPRAGEPLEPSTARDMDWRGGCLNLVAAPAVGDPQ